MKLRAFTRAATLGIATAMPSGRRQAEFKRRASRDLHFYDDIGVRWRSLALAAWPLLARPIIDWMRVIVLRDDVSPTPGLALKLAATLIVVMLLLAIAISAARWTQRRLGVAKPATAVIALMFAVFMLAFTAETASQMMRAAGALTASDATGFLFDAGQLTVHGWETIARRALVAALYAGLVAGLFGVAHARLTRAGQSTPST